MLADYCMSFSQINSRFLPSTTVYISINYCYYEKRKVLGAVTGTTGEQGGGLEVS